MSENRMLLDEIRELKRRLQALETRGEHPGFAASDVARLSEDNTFTGAVNTFDNDVDIDGDLTVGGDATITGVVQASAAWIPGVAVSLDAKLYCGFNGDEPFETDYTGSSTAHRGQAGTETGGVIYRPGKFGKAVQVAEGTTNLITNPRPLGLTWYNAYTAGGTQTLGISSDALVGSDSLDFQFSGSGASYVRTQFSAPVVPGTAYTISVYYKVVSGSSFSVGLSPQVYDVSYSTNEPFYYLVSPIADGEWHRITYSFTPSAGKVNCIPRIYVSGSTCRVLLACAQLEAKAYATPYHDGSLTTPTSWSGTAHASTSSRKIGVLTYPGSCIDLSRGTIGFWYYEDGQAKTSFNRLLGERIDSNNYLIILPNGSSGDRKMYAERNSAGVSTSTSVGAVAANVGWNHVVVTFEDGGNLKAYLNGVQSGATVAYVSPVGTAVAITVGYDASRWNNSLFDDLFILSRAASADEIRAIYESQSQLICS